MKSLQELFRIGPGPSSSHTLGPQRAAKLFREAYPNASSYKAELYGSLSLTGKGHMSDVIIVSTFAPRPCTVHFKSGENLKHPNTMMLYAYDEQEQLMDRWIVYSVGGGAIEIEGKESSEGQSVYPHASMREIQSYCKEKGIRLCDYVDQFEEVDGFLEEILLQMCKTVDQGLNTSGLLPGKLKLERIGRKLLDRANQCDHALEREKLLLSAYAYSASEENAAGGVTVTAPTLGSSGVLPALIYYYYYDRKVQREALIKGLKIAGIIGNLIKTNATISGAQGGCQAEIGAACAMGAAMVAYLRGLDDHQIEYAAEMGIEHHLGLTCDPVGGYVMIPCIERNAVATLRALDAAILAEFISKVKQNRVSFDMIVNTMNYTGKKLPMELRETSLGGLAKIVPVDPC
ncbi:MAG: L-serine ammonia-lyase [Erysipelotrichaceae bacterium]|nr:L-serine ammonia-lyase [Erysipelotrichaceae bacterium]